jgi:hypothetical protein
MQIRRRLIITARLARHIQVAYSIYGFDKVVEDLHVAFGGDLWIKERLCWSEGKQVVQAIQ